MRKRLALLLVLLGGFAGVATAQDAFDLSTARIADTSPQDIASWPATVHLDRITFEPGTGITIAKSGANWPDFVPAGFDGPIQYTVWVCARVPGWTCVGVVQMWRDRGASALPTLPSHYPLWWGNQAGGAIHQPFNGYVPHAGDAIAFFLTSGNARGETDHGCAVCERSNVALVTLSADDSGDFTFPISAPPVPPPPVTGPPAGVPPPIVTWSADVDLDDLSTRVSALEAQASAAAAAFSQLQAALTALTGRTSALESKPIPASCSASVFGVPVHCALR